MLRAGSLSPSGLSDRSPGLRGLAIITEDEALKSPETIPNISIDDSFLTARRQSIAKGQIVADGDNNFPNNSAVIPNESLCGARIAVYRHTSTGQPKQRSVATIAGIVRVGDRRFALTAAHVFFEDGARSSSWADSSLYANSCCTDDISGDVAPPKISEAYEVIIESYWPNSADPDIHAKPTNISLGLVAPSVLHRRKRPQAATLPEVVWDDELDWALIEIRDNVFWQMNMLHLSRHIDVELKPPTYDQKPPSEDVIIAGGISGAVLGIGLNTTEKIRVPWMKSSIEAWTVDSSEIGTGDYGAAVVCPRTGVVYGIAISHDSELSKTYLIPAPAIFDSILNRYSDGHLSPGDLFAVSDNTSTAATLNEEQLLEEFIRPPIVRSASTDVMSIFMSTLKGFSMQSIDGRRFVRRAALTQWMQTPRRDGIPIIDFMLDHAYPRSSLLPITREQISGGDETCLVVFALLFELGRANLIHLFIRQGLTDIRLPFDKSLLNNAIDRMSLDDSDSIADDIIKHQWAYCPMNLDLEMERDVPAHIVIPVHQRHQINSKGGSAKLWQITVLEEFVGKRLQTASIRARFNDASDKLGYRYHFAVKSFPTSQTLHFKTEVQAFKAFRTVPSMIGYLGNFHYTVDRPSRRAPSFSVYEDRRTDPGREETNNVLLEYGDFDLDEYFAATQPPVLSIQVTQFWQDMAGIAEAISEIHQFSARRGGVRQEFSGWHADIKPDNILNVKGVFKLADPGFARVESSDKKHTVLVGGTKAFGSPEAFATQHQQDQLVSQAIDIWSLGCVLSVAATWVILGWHGVVQYQQLRVEALKRLAGLSPNNVRNRSRNRSRSGSTGRTSGLSVNSNNLNTGKAAHTPEGDCFHDGEKVLEEVLYWHQFLRSVVRRNDEVSIQMLDLIDTKMLATDPEDRIEATELYKQMRSLVHNCEVSPFATVSDIVGQILVRTDGRTNMEGPRLSAMTMSSAISETSPRSPSFKRSSRSLNLPSPHMPLSSSMTVASSSAESEDVVSQPLPVIQTASSAAGDIRNAPNFRGIAMMDAASRSVSSSINVPMEPGKLSAGPLKPARRMSVSEARAEIDRKRKMWSRKKKDPFLLKHLEDRDIEFLVDNGDTMTKHWTKMTELIEILCFMVADIDKDGFDLAFTTGTIKLKQKSSTKVVRSTMENANTKPKPGVRTDMSEALDRTLGQYCSRLKTSSSSSSRSSHHIHRPSTSTSSAGSGKKYTLIVLTDGIWRGTSDAHAVEDTIIRRFNEIARHHGSSKTKKERERDVTIQFVQFGKDEEATHRLEALDRGVMDFEIPDIIDTEPSDGNVLKMLLGSVEASFDYADSGA